MINPLPRLPEFEYIRLDSIEGTVQFLKNNTVDAHPFLGGTDTFVLLRDRRLHPKYLVDLKHLEGFDALSFDLKKGLTIGAAVNLNQLISSKVIQEHYPILTQAARQVGGYQLRNRATLVGNLCNASPCGDTIGPSIIYHGKANIVGPEGTRDIPLEEFFIGPGKTCLGFGEIVQSLSLPLPPEQNKGIYLCIGRNKLSDLAMAGVTVLAYPDETSTSGYRFRIALSAVAPTVIVVKEAQVLLSDDPINASTLEKAAQISMQNCKPIDDIRASAGYRREMIYTLTLRALQQVWKALKS
ncbi:MAG: xanthine dehydrogenase family protein subunit M [Chloroflexota bacterium]|nr:xanthine dehydrogenase family protein subunit M [Chloroflexota bacterium]